MPKTMMVEGYERYYDAMRKEALDAWRRRRVEATGAEAEAARRVVEALAAEPSAAVKAALLSLAESDDLGLHALMPITVRGILDGVIGRAYRGELG